MSAHHNVHDTIRRLYQIELSPKELEDIWEQIERNLSATKSSRPVRHSRRSRISSWAAGSAAVLLIGIGGLTYEKLHGANGVGDHPTHRIGVGIDPSNGPNHLESYVPPSEVTVQGVLSDTPAQVMWKPVNESGVNKLVVSLLQKAKQTAPPTPNLSAAKMVFHAYFGPSRLQLFVHGQSITVYPAYSIVPNPEGNADNGPPSYKVAYVNNTVVYQIGNQKVYLDAPDLYEWLRQNLWQQVCSNPSSTDYERIGNLELGQFLSNVQDLYGVPGEKTTVHGQGGPEWVYPSNGLKVFGDPVWEIQVTAPFTGGLTTGIHIGSLESDVQKAYPNARVFRQGTDVSYLMQTPDRWLQLGIEVRNGTVFRITQSNALVPQVQSSP